MQWFYWGGTLGLAFLGPAYDFILQGSAYIILDFVIIIFAGWQLLLLILHGAFRKEDDNTVVSTELFIFGFSKAAMIFLITILIPLLVSSR